jgi:hypothetical protein
MSDKHTPQVFASDIEDILERFGSLEMSEPISEGSVEHTTLTLWVPQKYKEKFDKLQERSRLKFGKLLKEVIKKSIDRVTIDEAS